MFGANGQTSDDCQFKWIESIRNEVMRLKQVMLEDERVRVNQN
jgi:hypothetical protein